MKKLTIVVVGAISFALLSASSALAQSNIPEPGGGGEVVVPPGEVVVPPGEVVVPPGVQPGSTAFTGFDAEPEVRGEVVVPPGAQPGSTAFTGFDITVWMLAAAALLVLGLGLLFAARRRSRSAAHT
jgi:LPXTG-motif cell wall-anchored protein